MSIVGDNNTSIQTKSTPTTVVVDQSLQLEVHSRIHTRYFEVFKHAPIGCCGVKDLRVLAAMMLIIFNRRRVLDSKS
jgi:hypothetical protein